MTHYRHSGNIFWGFILILLGLLFLFQNMDYLDVGDVIARYWPLILILIGLKIILNKRRGFQTENRVFGIDQKVEKSNEEDARQSAGKNSYQQAQAQTYNNVFGDVRLSFDDLKINQFFTNNVFGDIDLNFSRAKFEGRSKIRVNGVFGDIEIFLPTGVQVEVKVNYLVGSSRIFDKYDSGLLKNISYSTPGASKNKAIIAIESSILIGDIRIHY